MGRSFRCVLFDIDGTLVHMRGAGARAMETSFRALTGVARAFDGIPMAGRTDRAILRSALEALAARGDPSPDLEEFAPVFIERYLVDLVAEATGPGPTVCPGVIGAIEALERRGVAIGLATGNFRGGAERKLLRFGLWARFAFGGFGDSTCERAEVLAQAAAEAMRVAGAAPAETLVVGDTDADVAAGRAVGARTMAVATGPFTAGDLAEAGPDLLFGDLIEAVRAGFWDLPRRDGGRDADLDPILP